MFVAEHNQASLLYAGVDFSVFAKPGGITTFNFVDTTRSLFRSTSHEINGTEPPKPYAVHHLDMDTSGCLVVSPYSETRSRLCRSFRERDVEKEYLAIVGGTPKKDYGVIDAPLLVEGSRHTHPTTKVHADGKPAETHYEILASDGLHSLLSLKPVTGVTHQIRVHCASVLGTPILGDPWYNPDTGQAEPPMYLHAYHISIPDNASADSILKVVAPLPSYMTARIMTMSGNSIAAVPGG